MNDLYLEVIIVYLCFMFMTTPAMPLCVLLIGVSAYIFSEGAYLGIPACIGTLLGSGVVFMKKEDGISMFQAGALGSAIYWTVRIAVTMALRMGG